MKLHLSLPQAAWLPWFVLLQAEAASDPSTLVPCAEPCNSSFQLDTGEAGSMSHRGPNGTHGWTFSRMPHGRCRARHVVQSWIWRKVERTFCMCSRHGLVRVGQC